MAAKFHTFVEPFAAIDPNVWTTFYDTGTADIEGGRLKLTGGGGVASVFTYDLADSYIIVNVELGAGELLLMNVQDVASGANATIHIGTDLLMQWVFFSGESQQVLSDSATLPYDPVAHRWLRIRQDSGGIVRWDTAPDGLDWTLRFTSSQPLDLSNAGLTMMLGGG